MLYRGGYGLNGFISVEEQHANDLPGYYSALRTHPHHNYHEGRAAADLTGWLSYFLRTLAADFQMVSAAVSAAADETAQRRSTANHPSIPDARFRIVPGLFNRQHMISSAHVAAALGLSRRLACVLLAHWVADGMLVPLELSRKGARAKHWQCRTGDHEYGGQCLAPTSTQ